MSKKVMGNEFVYMCGPKTEGYSDSVQHLKRWTLWRRESESKHSVINFLHLS